MKHPFYVRVAAGSLLAVPATMVVLLTILFAVGGRPPPGVAALLIPLAVACLVLGALLWLSQRLLLPVAVICAFMTLVALGLGAEFGLAHPESFFDFVTSVVTVAGPLVASVACVIAFVKRRRQTLELPPGPLARRELQVVVGLIAVLVVMSAVLTFTKRATVVAAGATAEVTFADDRFYPDDFRLQEGDRVEFLLHNDDSYAHTFTIDEFEIDQYVAPRGQRLVRFTVPDVDSDVELYCAIVGHNDMVGTIVVALAGRL